MRTAAILLATLWLGGCATSAVERCGRFPCGFKFSEFCLSPEGKEAAICGSSYAGAIPREAGDRVYQASLFHELDMWRFILYIRADGTAAMYGPEPGKPPKPVSPEAVRRFEETLTEIRFDEGPTYLPGSREGDKILMCGHTGEFTIERYDDASFKVLMRNCREIARAAKAWEVMVEIAEAAGVDTR